jgi:hypothetical protein
VADSAKRHQHRSQRAGERGASVVRIMAEAQARLAKIRSSRLWESDRHRNVKLVAQLAGPGVEGGIGFFGVGEAGIVGAGNDLE